MEFDNVNGLRNGQRMPINISPEEESAIVRLAARIRGARGGAAKTKRKSRSSRRNVKLAVRARKLAAVAA